MKEVDILFFCGHLRYLRIHNWLTDILKSETKLNREENRDEQIRRVKSNITHTTDIVVERNEVPCRVFCCMSECACLCVYSFASLSRGRKVRMFETLNHPLPHRLDRLIFIFFSCNCRLITTNKLVTEPLFN